MQPRAGLLASGTFWVMFACSSSSESESSAGSSESSSGSSSDSEESSSSDSSEGTTTSTTETGPAGPSYTAAYVAGDPQQLQIRQRDDELGRCTWLVLTDDALGFLAISTPSGWSPRTAFTNENPASCATNPASGGMREVTSAQGSVTETAPGTVAPCTIDFDVSLVFEADDFTTQMTATGIAVEGCDG